MLIEAGGDYIAAVILRMPECFVNVSTAQTSDNVSLW